MRWVRLVLHVLVASVCVLSSAVSLLIEVESPQPRMVHLVLFALAGAWAGASPLLRTLGSVVLSMALVLGVMHVAARGEALPVLLMTLWAVVLWRRISEPALQPVSA